MKRIVLLLTLVLIVIAIMAGTAPLTGWAKAGCQAPAVIQIVGSVCGEEGLITAEGEVEEHARDNAVDNARAAGAPVAQDRCFTVIIGGVEETVCQEL